jgi:hypothetical protein
MKASLYSIFLYLHFIQNDVYKLGVIRVRSLLYRFPQGAVRIIEFVSRKWMEVKLGERLKRKEGETIQYSYW